MQSTRFLAANMLRQQPVASLLRSRTALVRMQPTSSILRSRTAFNVQPTRGLRFQATPKRMMPVPKEEQSGHTISQRLRKLKRIPPELVPLGVVLAVAIVFAGYALIHKLFTDKTLRLYRTGGSGKASEKH